MESPIATGTFWNPSLGQHHSLDNGRVASPSHCTSQVLASGIELRSQPYSNLSPPISYRIAESFDDMLFAARP